MKPKLTTQDAIEILNITPQALLQTLKRKNLGFEKSKNRVYWGYEASRDIFNFNIKPQKIAFQVVKGGVGKSSIAFSFSVCASLYGLKVLMVDLDQQGNLTDFCRVKGDDLPCIFDAISNQKSVNDLIVNVSPGLDLIPGNLENALIENYIFLHKLNLKKVYSTKFNEIKNNYDLIVVDCPPALGHSNAGIALAVDTVIAIVTPDNSSIKGLNLSYEQLNDLADEQESSLNLRIVFNKFDKRTSLSYETLEKLIKHPTYGPLLYRTYISNSQEFSNASASGQTVFDALKESTAKTDIHLLTREILGLEQELLSQKKRQQESEVINSAVL
jgi:chromosome partitioning protein